MALNIADLAEHAIDAVPDRVALISGDEQLTYGQLEEKANRLAHYLIDQGVKKDDKVGLYCRNRIEIVIGMLGIVKAGAILVNVNFRYVEGELKYLFDNSDMVALIHERRYADRVANVLPETPNVKTILVVEDGSDDDFQRYGGVAFEDALAQGSPERDFGPRSADDIYLLYTGGTTGFPKGVMWRHEDIYRVLFGGTDFATGEPVADEYDLSKQAVANPPMIRLPIPPMIHGATQSATWMSLFSGQTVVLAPEFNADEVWQMIHDHKVNLLFFTGDAMARPLLDSLLAAQAAGKEYDLSSLFLLASTAALFSTSLKEKFLELLPNRIITDSIGSSETGFGGTSIVAKGQSHTGGPRVTIDKNTKVLDENGNEVKPGSGVRGIIAKCGHIPVGYFKDEKKTAETFRTYNGVRYAIPGDYAEVEADGSVTMLGRGRCRSTPVARRSTPKRSRPRSRVIRTCSTRSWSAFPTSGSVSTSRPWCSLARGPARPWPSSMRSYAARLPVTRCRAASGWSTRSSARRRASPTTGGPRTPPRSVPPTTCTPITWEPNR